MRKTGKLVGVGERVRVSEREREREMAEKLEFDGVVLDIGRFPTPRTVQLQRQLQFQFQLLSWDTTAPKRFELLRNQNQN